MAPTGLIVKSTPSLQIRWLDSTAAEFCCSMSVLSLILSVTRLRRHSIEST